MNAFILTIDQSTSATKAILFDDTGRLHHRVTIDHQLIYPQPGWVSQDAGLIFCNTCRAVSQVLTESGADPRHIRALALTNQRESVVVWDRHTGEPIDYAIGWQCQRASELCKEIAGKGLASLVRAKTGLVLSPYFSAAKISWLLDNVDGARERAARGDLLAGTFDSWLIWRLTGGRVHATDYSNASRTQLLNLATLSWDPELLEIFRIPVSMLPQIQASDTLFGTLDPDLGLGLDKDIPISGIMGDSHAALFGQACFAPGMAKATYGTGSSIMMNIGRQPIFSSRGLVTSIAWQQGGVTEYVFEGNINCTGATIKWLAEDLELIRESREAGPLAASVADNGGVYLVPAFVGLGAPYWDSDARATITGLSRGSRKAHVVRAAEESIAYQIKDVLDLMITESGYPLRELRVDGGPTRDGFLMQFQADMLGTAVACANIEELSAFGSALMGGMAIGLWRDKSELAGLRRSGRDFQSDMDAETREKLYLGWQAAVRKTLTQNS